MKLSKILSAVGTSLILIGPFTPAQADTSTDVVLNLEGNPTCSSLGDNSQVLEFRDSNPDSTPGSPRFVELNIVDINGDPAGTQVVEYSVTSTNPPTMDWKIIEVNDIQITSTDLDELEDFFREVNPINYIILKAQGGNKGARVFHFGAFGPGAGAIVDQDEEAPGSTLAAASFCYGLTTSFGQVEEPEPLPVVACEDITVETLDGTGIVCANDGKERLLINMELNAENFGFDDAFHACTCNVTEDVGGTLTATGLPECNPKLAAVEKGSQDENTPPEERSCMEYDITDANSDGVPDAGVNNKVPLLIQGVENPDSYICYTIDGVRTCYGHY